MFHIQGRDLHVFSQFRFKQAQSLVCCIVEAHGNVQLLSYYTYRLLKAPPRWIASRRLRVSHAQNLWGSYHRAAVKIHQNVEFCVNDHQLRWIPRRFIQANLYYLYIKAHSVRRPSSSIGLAVHAVRYLHESFRANFDTPPPRSSEPIWDAELKLYIYNYNM